MTTSTNCLLNSTFPEGLRTDSATPSSPTLGNRKSADWVLANKSVVRERLQQKREDSDADYGVYLQLRKDFEPIREAHLVLHSDKISIAEMLEQATAWVQSQQ